MSNLKVAKILMAMFFAIIALCALMVMSGCKARADASVQATKNIGTIGKSTARIEVRAEVIAKEAKKLPSSEPKTTILEQTGEIKADTVEAAAEADKALVNMSLMAGTINNQATEIAVLKAENAGLKNRYIGPKLVKVIGWCVAGVFAFGFLSTALGILSPGGWGLILSRAINANIMLPFVWLRDFILRIRGFKVAAVPSPVVGATSQ